MKNIENLIENLYLIEGLPPCVIANKLKIETKFVNNYIKDKKIKRKRLSPFSREFWINKGFSEEEADIMRNSQRPIRKEYWIQRGFSEEEAIKKALQVKNNNNKKGALASSKRDMHDIKKSSRRCKEYWLDRGFSEKEAIEKVSEYQSTFSKEKCIKKHGDEKGLAIWKERQDKWQETLKSKSKEEISLINSNKNSISLSSLRKNGLSNEEIQQIHFHRFGTLLFLDIQEFENHIIDILNKNPHLIFLTVNKFAKKFCKLQKDILNIDNSFFEKFLSKNKKIINKRNGKQYYSCHVDEGYLRSSHEMFFYELCKNNNINFIIEKKYPNSNMRCDFYLPDYHIYIEIAPLYNKEEKYTKKMDKKREKFNCVILENVLEYISYIEKLIGNE